MVYLRIKPTKQSEKEVQKLESILNAWDLKIVQCEIDEENLVLNLVINASMPAIMIQVVSVAQSRFREDLLETNTCYEY